MSKWMRLGTIAAILAVMGLVAFGAVAWAQGPTPTPQAPNTGPGLGRGFGMGGSMLGGAGGPMMGGQQNSLITIAAKVLNMKDTDLLAALKDKSIADVAKEKGVSLDKIVTEFLAPRIEAMQAFVKAGRMTQAQADAAIATIKTNVTAQLSEKFTAGQGECPMTGGPMLDDDNDGVCDYCGRGLNGQTPNGQTPTYGPMRGGGMRGRWSN